jgi:multisubunit Na+/H+ antiporter MnhG subunit
LNGALNVGIVVAVQQLIEFASSQSTTESTPWVFFFNHVLVQHLVNLLCAAFFFSLTNNIVILNFLAYASYQSGMDAKKILLSQ